MAHEEHRLVPDRFVYVCIATKFGDVNVVPLLHLGVERAAEIVILCGSASMELSKGPAFTDAIAPAHRLRQFFANKLPGIPVIIDNQNPERFEAWKPVAERLAKRSDPIVLNVAGGRRTVSLAVSSYLRGAGADFREVLTTQNPVETLVVCAEEGSVHTHKLPRTAGLSIEDHFLLAGYRRKPKRTDLLMAEFAKQNAGKANRIGNSLLVRRGPGWDWRPAARKALGATMAAYSKVEGVCSDRIWEIDNRNDRSRLKQPIGLGRAPEGGAELFDAEGECQVFNGAAFRGLCEALYAGGRWLEDFIHGLLQEALRDKLVEGAVLMFAGETIAAAESDQALHEADIAIWKSDQLHLVEVKCYTSKKGLIKSIGDLERFKAKLATGPSNAWIVAPFVAENEVSDARERGTAGGITVLAGPNAVSRLIQQVKQLP